MKLSQPQLLLLSYHDHELAVDIVAKLSSLFEPRRLHCDVVR